MPQLRQEEDAVMLWAGVVGWLLVWSAMWGFAFRLKDREEQRAREKEQRWVEKEKLYFEQRNAELARHLGCT